jgi:hypothetical protein
MICIPTITSPSYIPSDDDILHVRIMTMGFVEHSFKVAIPAVSRSFSLTSPFKRKHDRASDDSISLLGKAARSNTDSTKYINMHIYDMGGGRDQRHHWGSFFEAATAVSSSIYPYHSRIHNDSILYSRICHPFIYSTQIIFLAPISVFDQFLIEDSEINRIRDSIELFEKICDNRLLADVPLVLFLSAFFFFSSLRLPFGVFNVSS